jgi:class 3 adenylate cyclase
VIFAMGEQPCEIGILFADVAGSTRLYRELGDSIAYQGIEDTLAAVEAVAALHRGSVVKTIGDEVMLAFPDAVGMFDAAIAIQQCANERQPLTAEDGSQRRVQLRLGMHFGAAIQTDRDYFGTSVNLAARMVELAAGGEIITTGAMSARLPPLHRGLLRRVGSVAVRGVDEAVTIAEVVWQATSDLTVLPQVVTTQLRLSGAPRLEISALGKRGRYDTDSGPITIGREPGNTLLVTDHRASRRHCTIERKLDNWVLSDHSTNGSFVTFEGDREIAVRRQDLVLHGMGAIRIGYTDDDSTDGLLRFAVVFE